MDFSWITTLLIAIIIIIIGYIIYMSSTHGTFRKLGIPGPQPWPILGTFGLQSKHGMTGFQIELFKKYKNERVVGTFDARMPVMVIKDLDMIRDISVKYFNHFVNRRSFLLDPPFDHALTMIKDDHWKNVRSTISPSFSTGKLRRMYQHVEKNTKILLENLKEKQERNEEVELKHILSCFTMDVIASTGFGVEINSFKDSNNKFEAQAKAVMNATGRIFALTVFFPFIGPLLKFLKVSVLPQQAADSFTSFIDAAMNIRKQGSDGLSHHDFLQLMMEAEDGDADENDNLSQEEANALKTSSGKKKLSYDDIQGQAFIFILAGYDTVASVMSFTMYLLSLYPDICKKVQQEIDENLGGAFPNYDNMQSLSYLDMCINESIRLYPPGFALDRECNEEVTIQGVTIPKGILVSFPIYAIHHDPNIWPEPEKFIPERFTAENKASRHPYAHLPFGQGPRNCIGMRLALLELKVAIAAILQRMTPMQCSKSVNPVKLSKFQLKAEDGLWVKMEARK